LVNFEKPCDAAIAILGRGLLCFTPQLVVVVSLLLFQVLLVVVVTEGFVLPVVVVVAVVVSSISSCCCRFGRVLSVQVKQVARSLHLRFTAFTGDAMGMNMVSKVFTH